MKYLQTIFLIILIHNSTQGQTWTYDYNGPPNDVKEYTIEGQPKDIFRLDFYTQVVPDYLIIYNEIQDSLVFYIGDRNSSNLLYLNHYRGYCEFEYKDGILINKILTGIYPPDYSFPMKELGGMMRIYYEIPSNECQLKFKVQGNYLESTIYKLKVDKVFEPFTPITDTFTVISCDLPKGVSDYQFVFESCKKRCIRYRGEGFQDEVITLKMPTCLDSLNGQITTEDTTYNDLGLGQHLILLQNQYCKEERLIELNQITGFECGQYYVPNIISKGQPTNNEFNIFFSVKINYQLEIYNRWGELIHKNNNSGWIPTNQTPNGVYAFVIKLNSLNWVIVGDVTIID